MGKREEKIALILDTTTQILTQEGISALSMRKVADMTQITLSNLQYYFKDKETLVNAVIANYFEWCEKQLQKDITDYQPDTLSFEVFLRHVLNQYLIVNDNNPQCSMFREIWALASKDPKIAAEVQAYYKVYARNVVQSISSFCQSPDEVVTLLLPYIEGYTIIGNALPIDKPQVVELLTKILLQFQ